MQEKQKRRTGLHKLSATQLLKLGKGYHSDGGNLYLDKTQVGKKGKWVFQFKSPVMLKNRKMGLGTYPEVTLAVARELALAGRRLLQERKDPLEERRKEERERNQSHGITFEKCAMNYISAKCKEWKGAEKGTTYRKHIGQLTLHAFPLIGNRPVASVDKSDILKILQPVLDQKKGRTASKLQEYLKTVLDYAKAHGWRDGDNPAEWKGNLDKILPDPSKIAPVKHHKALKSSQMPDLMKALSQSQGTASLAVRFVILNASRSGEGRKATWEEIDLESGLWIIPAERMKTKQKHIVTLSSPALALLKEVKPLSNGKGLIFPNSKGKPLSDVMLLKAVKIAGQKIGEPDATLHGLRATFRTWASDETNHAREVAEHALSHVVGNSVERAYSRGTMEEKRRHLMEDWGLFCMGESE